MTFRLSTVFAAGLLLAATSPLHAEYVDSIDLIGRLTPDRRVAVEAFDDPEVEGVSCYVAHTRKSGIGGAIAQTTDHALSVLCRQVGPLKFKKPLAPKSEVLAFKHLHVMRIADPKRNALVYLTYSEKPIDNGPDTGISIVTVPDQKIPLK